MRNKLKFLTLILLIRVGTNVHVNPEQICATEKSGKGTTIYMAMFPGATGPLVIKSDWGYDTVLQALYNYQMMAERATAVATAPAPVATPTPSTENKKGK